MSYDYRLFKRIDGEDPLVTAQRDSEGFPSTPPDPQTEALKRRVADALIAHNPQLKIFQFEYEEIAKFEEISVEAARCKYRHLELQGPDEGSNGIQITLYDDEASVTVPFWHEGDKAADTFREIWQYLEIISRESGYSAYDPQIYGVLDLSAGYEEALASYAGTVCTIRKALPVGGTRRKPWWKFW